jgi:hypothetical protein
MGSLCQLKSTIFRTLVHRNKSVFSLPEQKVHVIVLDAMDPDNKTWQTFRTETSKWAVHGFSQIIQDHEVKTGLPPNPKRNI